MQTCEGYVENGQFYPLGALAMTSVKLRAFLTVLNEPAKKANVKGDKSFWAEFDRLAALSVNEELREEHFPRMKLGRESAALFEEG